MYQVNEDGSVVDEVTAHQCRASKKTRSLFFPLAVSRNSLNGLHNNNGSSLITLSINVSIYTVNIT